MRSDNPIVITWNEAEAEAERIRKEQEQQSEEKLNEFLDSDLSMIDARDIHYYAEITGKSANELRRMHTQSEEMATMAGTFEGDATDDIIDFF